MGDIVDCQDSPSTRINVKSLSTGIISARERDPPPPPEARVRKTVRFGAGVGPSRDVDNQVYTLSDLKKNSDGRQAVWIAIDGYVYNVARFLNEHPGGDDILLKYAGRDATKIFKDVGHSADARALMKQYRIGRLPSTSFITDPVVAFVTFLLVLAGAYSIAMLLGRKRH